MKYSKIMIVLLLLSALSVNAQETIKIDSLIVTGKQKLQQATNKWQESQFIESRAYFERLLSNGKKAWLTHYYIALTDFRLFSFHFTQEHNEKATMYIDDGISHLRQSIEIKNDFSDAYNLLSALYGNKIGLKPWAVMTLGPKSGKAMGRAMELEQDNPRNYLISALSAYYTPKMFGGGVEKARIAFEKSIALFDSVQITDMELPTWGYDEAHAWLGQLFMDREEFDKAQMNFERALQINKNYGWVREILMPELNRRIEASSRN